MGTRCVAAHLAALLCAAVVASTAASAAEPRRLGGISAPRGNATEAITEPTASDIAHAEFLYASEVARLEQEAETMGGSQRTAAASSFLRASAAAQRARGTEYIFVRQLLCGRFPLSRFCERLRPTNTLELEMREAEAQAVDADSVPLPDYCWKARLFCGDAEDCEAHGPRTPGPVLNMRRGERVLLTVKNRLDELEKDKTTSANSYINTFHFWSRTNIHTHGLFVSPRDFGSASLTADNTVTTDIERGQDKTYEYLIPWDHMGGLFWGHPHRHGSTASQSAGGAAMLIVMEENVFLDSLPLVLTTIERTVELVTAVAPFLFGNKVGSATCGQNCGTPDDPDEFTLQADPLWTNNGNTYTCAGADNRFEGMDDFVLFNGVKSPRYELEQARYRRFSWAYSALDTWLDVFVAGGDKGGTCTLDLLAKDGIFLSDAPRRMIYLRLWPGERVDFLIRCNGEVGEEFALRAMTVAPEQSTTNGNGPEQTQRGAGTQRRPGAVDPLLAPLYSAPRADPPSSFRLLADQTLGTFVLTQATTPDLGDVPLLNARYPRYLASKPPKATVDFNMEFFGPSNPTRGAAPCNVNGAKWEEGSVVLDPTGDTDKMVQAPVHTMRLDTYETWLIRGVIVHTFHLHVYPMQVVEVVPDSVVNEALPVTCAGVTSAPGSAGAACTPWVQAGDWHDTLMTDPAQRQAFKVNFNVQRYDGLIVMHCHFLNHEDFGCMTLAETVAM